MSHSKGHIQQPRTDHYPGNQPQSKSHRSLIELTKRFEVDEYLSDYPTELNTRSCNNARAVAHAMRRASLEYPTAYGRGYKTFSIPRMQEHVHDTGTRIFAIGEDKSLHAGLIASHIDHTRTSIDYLFRFRDMQTHGVGKLLLKHYLQDCLQYADYETINLEVVSNNMPARVLYESIGFVATRNVKGRGHKLLAMELDTRRAIEQAITQLDAFSV